MSASAGRFPLILAVAALALGGCTTTGKSASELPAAMQSAAKPDDKKPDDMPGAAKDDKTKDDKAKADDKTDARKPAPAEAQSKSESDPGPPLERHEVVGQCWMLADKRGSGMDAKIKMVDKCVDDRMKADAARRGAGASR